MIRNMIDFNHLDKAGWMELYKLAEWMMADPREFGRLCSGRILATLFYEASTRTQFSFQAAAMRLGAGVLGFSGTDGSSVAKGESLKDTIRMISGYADAIVIRHPVEGSAYAASLYSPVPVINAGDGGHLHPTQTMTDFFTIKKLAGTYEGLSIGVCGDLLNGRTVHSLLKAFAIYNGNTFYLISSDTLALPDEYIRPLEAAGNRVIRCGLIEDCIRNLDFIYMTRIQRERFDCEEEYARQVGIYVLDAAKMKLARREMYVLHPLPRVDEITTEVDDDPRAKYFIQAENGMYIRMALLSKLLCAGKTEPEAALKTGDGLCPNPKCITAHEGYLPQRFESGICMYCEK